MGSGSAGGTLAARLAEVDGWRVLLLEAGGLPPPESDIPGLNPILLQSEIDWHYFTVPQKHGLRGYVGDVSVGCFSACLLLCSVCFLSSLCAVLSCLFVFSFVSFLFSYLWFSISVCPF